MPDKTVSPKSSEEKPVSKPRLKVEEVVDEPVKTEPEVKNTEPEKAETPSEPEAVKEETPKVTSFSMVDTAGDKPALSEATPESSEKVETAPEVKEDAAPSETATPSTDSGVSSSEIQEWLQNVRPETAPSVSPEKGGNLGKVLAVFLVLFILGALGGGMYYYQTNVADQTAPNNETVNANTTSQDTSPTVTPSPEPTTAAVDVSSFKLQVLNGSGTPGEAGKAQGYLESAGFKSFKTGNASAFNYANTEVAMKATVSEEVFTALEKALSDHYQGVVKSDKALSDSSAYDIVITVGKPK